MPGVQLGTPWAEHPSRDVKNKGMDDVDACPGHKPLPVNRVRTILQGNIIVSKRNRAASATRLQACRASQSPSRILYLQRGKGRWQERRGRPRREAWIPGSSD